MSLIIIYVKGYETGYVDILWTYIQILFKTLFFGQKLQNISTYSKSEAI